MKQAETREKRSGWGRALRLGLQGKMMLGLLCSLAIVLLITGFILLRQSRNEVGRLTDSYIEEQTHSIQQDTEAYFRQFISSLSIVANMDQLQGLIGEANTQGQGYRFENSELCGPVARDLSNALESFPEGAINLFAVCAGNNELLRSNGTSTDPSYRVAEDPWWQQLASSGDAAVVTGAYEISNIKGLIVTVAVPIRQNGKLIGAVGSDISLQLLSERMKKLHIGETGYVVAFDLNGNVVYHPDSSLILNMLSEMNYSDNMKQAVAEHTDAHSMMYQVGDRDYHGSTRYVPAADWQIVGCMEHQEYVREINRFAGTVVICFALTAILLAAVAWISVYFVVRPLRKLAVVSDQLAQGSLDVQVDIRSNDEIGDLALSTTHIVDRLKTYIVYIDEVALVLEKIARRDLVFTLEQEYAGEFNKLKLAMEDIQCSLTEAMLNILHAAEQVEVGSEQMSSGAQGLAQGATEQADTVDQLAGAVQQLTAQAADGASKALTTNQDVSEIGGRIEACNCKMQDMLHAMENIQNRSAKIGEIIKTSEDIAFQTNILALNASVEAARAGSAGKGFAVVANEVRKLAGSSTESAKAIAELIQDTIAAVQEGASIAASAAGALHQVTEDMEHVIAEIGIIAETYHRESDDLEHVSEGLNQVSSVVQTNSATAEESAATAEELAGQVALMKQLVDSFELDPDHQGREQ